MSGKLNYHHGDLRRTLLQQASEMIARSGVEGLTLRKLAEQAGVSQTALYHHFQDKNDLLCALGAEGLEAFDMAMQRLLSDTTLEMSARFKAFAAYYVRYAVENPEHYELMFGRTTWRHQPTEGLRRCGRNALRHFAEIMARLQQQGQLPSPVSPLRVAQISWGALHGLCCLMNDGIFPKSEDVEEISRYAVEMMQKAVAASTR